jgi:glycosyltransferase involved in cell wall biosynthesis
MTILKDVSLCAIVRDEKINPAGGIKRFIESHVPYVDEAVIVDTGSVDGTREILEDLSSNYKNMKVYDKQFRGFTNARNYSLKKANCEWVLILDADELITHKKPKDYWNKLKKAINVFKNYSVFEIPFVHLSPTGIKTFVPSWRERLSKKGALKFKKRVWENHNYSCKDNKFLEDILIYHFLPPTDDILTKMKDYYEKFDEIIIDERIPPSQIKGFQNWKKYNLQRDKYI